MKHLFFWPSPKINSDYTRWLKLALYQLMFILFLTLYFVFVLWAYLATLDNFSPRIRNRKTQIALSVRPISSDPYTTLIEFTPGFDGTWRPLKKSIRDYLKPYGHGKFPGTSLKCRWEDRIDKQNWCHVSRRKLIDWSHDVQCSRSENFGFALAQPCIILKPTKIFDWEPEPYYNITEVQQLPQMPKRLKNEISKTWDKHCKGQGEKMESKCPRLRMVWVTCEGETLMDTEYMGPVHLTPMNGFPGKYFPFVNQNHYLSPLISIQFRNLTPGVLVSVVCKLWAKNIRHDTQNPFIGGTRFELRMN